MSRFRRRLMGLSALRQAMKDDFVRVEYIQNPSKAYINTLYRPSNNTSVEVKLKYIENIVQWKFVYGVEQPTYRFSFLKQAANAGHPFRFDFGTTTNAFDYELVLNQLLTIKQDRNKLYIDDILIGESTFISSFRTPYNLYIFTCSQKGRVNEVYNNQQIRLYGFKIWENDVLIRDYIPMYQISTDTYGLWDRVTEEFYTSPNGVKFTGGERYDTTDIIEVHPKLIANTYINENSGAQQNYRGWSSSDYIDVEGFKYIQVPYPFPQSDYKYGAYYDKDKRRISNTSSFVIPSNAKYVRLSTKTSTFTNIWLFKRQLTTTDIYRANSYIETDGSIRAYNGWNIFNTESVYNYFYCWIYAQSYRYQASYNADGSVYQSGKGFLERPEGGKVLLSDSNTSITYYAGYNYEYKNMNE